MKIVSIPLLDELKEIIKQTFDPSYQGVVAVDRDFLTIFIESNSELGYTYEMMRICPERIFGFATGIDMPSAHFFFEPYNDHINYYIAAGFVEASIGVHYRDMNSEISKEDKEAEVLTMDHLGAAFVICFIPAIFGLIAFAGEIIHAWNIKRQQTKVKVRIVKKSNNKTKKRVEKLENQKFKVELDTTGI